MIQKTLIAVNDSRAALHAFLEALSLDRHFQCRLIAASVAPLYEGDLSLVGVKNLKSTLEEPALSVLEEAIRIAEEEGLGLTTFKARGDRAGALLDLARRESCDLIVMGREPSPFHKAWNSVTAALLRQSPVDLLVIPDQKPLRFDYILFEEDSFLLFPLPWKESLSDTPSPIRVHQGPVETIPQAAQSSNADLIVLRQDTSHGLLKRLTGSAAYRIVRAAPCPVWIIAR